MMSETTELLKEILLRLASKKLPPSPLNIKKIYEEINGQTYNELIEVSELRTKIENFVDAESDQWKPFFKTPNLINLIEAIRGATEQKQFLKTLNLQIHDDLLSPLAKSERNLQKYLEALKSGIESGDNEKIVSALSSLGHYLPLISENQSQIIEGLRRLIISSAKSALMLVENEQSMIGHIQTLMRVAEDKTITYSLVVEAEKAIETLTHYQSNTKNKIHEQREEIKKLIKEFVSQLASDSQLFDQQSEKLNDIVTHASKSETVIELRAAMQEMLDEASVLSDTMKTVHGKFKNKQDQISDAQQKILSLEKELALVSQRVKEDVLTGALNRRGLEEAAKRDISNRRRHGAPLCVAVIDIDDFKKINDTLGHSTGDDVLKYFSDTLKTTLRPSDSVCRFGGEEFVILLPHTDLVNAKKIVQRAQRALTKDYWCNNENKLITFSSGITEYLEDDPLEDMIERADRLMYAAKKAGKNKVFTDTDMT